MGLSEVLKGMQTYKGKKLISWLCWYEPEPHEPDSKPNYIHILIF